MKHHKSMQGHLTKKQNTQPEVESFSPATMKVAARALKEFERQADEDFLARAEIERKLSSF